MLVHLQIGTMMKKYSILFALVALSAVEATKGGRGTGQKLTPEQRIERIEKRIKHLKTLGAKFGTFEKLIADKEARLKKLKAKIAAQSSPAQPTG